MTTFGLDVPVERRAIKPHCGVTLDLPFPPGVNNLYNNSHSRGRHKSERYERWISEAGWLLLSQRPGRISGAVELSFIFEDKAGHRDIDGLLKAPIDLLVKHGVIEGDHRSIVRALEARWSAEISGARVIVRPILLRAARAA